MKLLIYFILSDSQKKIKCNKSYQKLWIIIFPIFFFNTKNYKKKLFNVKIFIKILEFNVAIRIYNY